MSGCKPSDTPMEPNSKLGETREGVPVHTGRYQRLVGKLIYLSHTRPDISFAVSMVSQFMHAPYEEHLEAIYKILRYLKGTPGKGLFFQKSDQRRIEVYTDADWAGSVTDKRSTSRYCTFLWGNLVTWRSKKQNVAARSSAEAEYRAMAQGICEILWLKKVLEDLHEPVQLPMKLFCDNKAAISIANNPVQHDHMKYVEIDRHFIKEKLEDGVICVSFLPTTQQIADAFTKGPKWPSSSFVSSDGLITAMAYRLPHVVMGDRSGNIRWWDVTTGHSSSFSTHREGIRRIKFSPVVPGDRSRGRIAVLFYDNTFSIFDLDSPDPMANSLLEPQFPGTLVLELDWVPSRTDKNDPLVLCIAGADSSFRLLEVKVTDKKPGYTSQLRPTKERFRPMPLCSPILLPTPHALALRMILQLGVRPSWFNTFSTTLEKRPHLIPGTPKSSGDLRNYMIDLPPIGDPVVPELLLKILEPYRKEGCILDDERAKLYAKLVNKGCAMRFAFAAAVFGESSEALFWLQLSRALNHLMRKLVNRPPQKSAESAADSELDDRSILSRITSKGKSVPGTGKKDPLNQGGFSLMAFEQEELWANANERIPWHEKLEGEEDVQNRVHELVSVGNLEAAVSLLLSTNPESKYFYVNALRAVALSSAVSSSLLELAVKVVAANMVQTDRSLSGTHLLCAVGRYQEACSQLQDAGCWTDAATLAATHLKGSDYARALILYVAAGALQEALAALREAQQPDTAAMFILACREIHSEIISDLGHSDDESSSSTKEKLLKLPGLDPENEDVIAVGEYYGEYQRKLVHLCMDSQPYSD
ncbi:hypothetical protein L484_016637 [Morus notabilis]|uniref:WD repeat-containing protein 11 n=1 Tax=Morus notabilis TaxID=981085 RepID=W9SB25_9ROSA|nr:hypothetical protein L484_016637 [Morus notabilis]